MSLKIQAVKGVKWTTIGTIVITIVGIIKISILARVLDKSDFGLMALIIFVLGIMDMFNEMGLTTAILHKQNISKEEYASLYWLNLSTGILLYAVVWVLTPLVASFYNLPQLTLLIRIAALSLVLSGIGIQFKTMESKNIVFKEITIIEIAAAIISLLFAIFLAVNKFGVYSLIYSLLLQSLFVNVAFLLIGVRKYGLLFHFRFVETKPFLKIGSYQVGGQIVNYFNRELDVILIGKLFSPSILGAYSLGKQLVMRPTQLINPILMKVASPILARFQFSKIDLKINFLKLLNLVFYVNLIIYSTIALLAPYLILLLYGPGYDSIVLLVRILCIYMVFRAIGNPIGSLIIATGKTEYELFWNIVTLLVMPICIFIGALFGIIQVTLMLLLGSLILFIPSWKFLIYKLTGAGLIEYLKALVALPKVKGLIRI